MTTQTALNETEVAELLGIRIPERRHLRVVTEPPPREHTPINPDTSTFDDFIGNTQAVCDLLSILEDSEAAGDIVYPHFLISGPFGTGKTEIANRIARRRGTKLHVIDDARKVKSEKRVAMLFGNVQEGDVVLVDEIHRARGNEEAFYGLLDNSEITVSAGAGRDETFTPVRVPPFTLIGATTAPGRLAKPLRSRFITLRLQKYSDAEISLIVMQEARKQGLTMTQDGADALAVLSRGTARIAKVELLTRAKAAARLISRKTSGEPVIDAAAVKLMQQTAGIDDLGLKEEERELLRALCITMTGGPIGALKLAEACGMDIEDIRDLEPHLFKEGLMFFDGRGRKARVEAYKLLSDTDPDGIVYRPPASVLGWSRNQGMSEATEAWLRSILR